MESQDGNTGEESTRVACSSLPDKKLPGARNIENQERNWVEKVQLDYSNNVNLKEEKDNNIKLLWDKQFDLIFSNLMSDQSWLRITEDLIWDEKTTITVPKKIHH